MRTPARRAMVAAATTPRSTADQGLPKAALRRQAARANSADPSTAPMVLFDGPNGPDSRISPGLGSAPARPGLTARAATIIEQRAAAPPPTDAPPADVASQDPADRLAAALPATAAERATAIAELRAARAAGKLTAAQAQRLRSLQQLRAARSARAARDAARRPSN
jgi:hypothetical protein